MNFKARFYQKAKIAGYTKKQADEMLGILCSAAFDTLHDGISVKLPDIGSLTVVDRKEQYRHNPQSGGKVLVPAGKRVKFRASSALAPILEKL